MSYTETRVDHEVATVVGNGYHIAACRDGSVQLNIIECNGELIVQETIADTYIDHNQRTVHVIEGYLS